MVPVFFYVDDLLPELLVPCLGTKGCAQLHHGCVVGEKESRAVFLFQFVNQQRVVSDEFHAALVCACSFKTVVEILSAVTAHVKFLKIRI